MSPDCTLDEPPPSSLESPEREAQLVDERKRRKKERKQRLDSIRQLDEWERYRALIDASEEAYDLIDIANREARFALLVMGALNALPLVLLSRSDAVSVLSRTEQYLLAALFAGYAVLVLRFILDAIAALRPGRFRPDVSTWPANALDRPVGIRYYEDVVQRSAREHWAAWQSVRVSQLNAELAIQIHGLALKNDAKHVALRRLYVALRVMALALAALTALFVVFAWT